MGTTTSKVNLAALKHVMMEKKGQSGMVRGVFIPVKANHLFESEKTGAVYLDMISFDLKEVKDDQSHLTKQSLPKEVREKMTEEEQKEQPIIGGLNVNFGGGGGDASGNAAEGKTFDADSEEDMMPF